jgi:hypothetical protein
MSTISYPCGCQTNGIAMLGMCLEHAMQLQEKEREDEKRGAEFDRLVTGSIKRDRSAPSAGDRRD